MAEANLNSNILKRSLRLIQHPKVRRTLQKEKLYIYKNKKTTTMKFKITSILFACAFLMLASCGDSSDSDKKDDSTEQADAEKKDRIDKLMSEYTNAAAELMTMLEEEAENEAAVELLYDQYMETEDEALSNEIDMQIEDMEAVGDEISDKVLDLMDPVFELAIDIEMIYDDLTPEQKATFDSTEEKVDEILDL